MCFVPRPNRNGGCYNSRYRLTLKGNSSHCQPAKTVLLNILQSGVYLNASLSSENAKDNDEKELSLLGILHKQNLSLSGKVPHSLLCQQPQGSPDKENSIIMQISLVDKGNFPGKLTINDIPKTLEFTAEPLQKLKIKN